MCLVRRLSSKEGKLAMLVGDMDLTRIMIHVKFVVYYKINDRENFHSKRAKTTGHESEQQKAENMNRSPFQKSTTRHTPSLVSALEPKNKCYFRNHNSENFRSRLKRLIGLIYV